ncbi:LysR family transcriptional regulator [Streptomyces phaeolivaceus]|uniref:LysR family transcriptional regulator n=1 Tax=Streptomyces phaeolivaceus TaxID=2653200 RepID=A0A5P8KCD8_9ACTN|nr:LysR family transcriptional regulator [Streptomyces phaeolivaceus]QFR00449.1 LysR family transcriptional regulator [Streptomyces phaeolivaceus]
MSNRPDFSLTQLLYFATIAETENISEAAMRLHASQSAVSSAMQRLERQLGVQLLLRQRAKGVVLTPAGRLLLKDVRKILRQAQELKDVSGFLQETASGHLDAGCCCVITPFLMPRALARAEVTHPRLRVTVHDTQTPYDLLRDGVCELVVTYRLSSAEDMVFTELARPALSALVSAEHPLAGEPSASLADFADLPLLMLALPHTGAHDAHIRRIYAASGTPMPRVIYATGLESLRGLVSVGMGFTLTHQPHSAQTLDGGRVTLVPVSGDHPDLPIGVLTMAGVRPSRRAESFVAALRATARQVYEPGIRPLLDLDVPLPLAQQTDTHRVLGLV